MEHQEEGTANQKEGYFGKYKCRWCTGTPEIPAPEFTSFFSFIDHLVLHKYISRHRHKAIITNPHSRSARGAPPFAAAPLASHEPKRGEKILPERKIFLPFIADWLEWALVSSPELNSIAESSILVADRLVALICGLPEQFQEQRDYLLAHQPSLEDTGKDPKWPRKPGHQVRFVADSMAGARWGLTPSTSREFIRRQRQKARTLKPREATLDTKALEQAILAQLEGRWWEDQEAKPEKSEDQ